jgi:glycine dehydrogenase subunit 1
MSCGGGAGGFIASRDDPRYAREYPTLLLSIAETVAGEHGFGIALFEQTSYGSREDGNDWTGNSVYLWAVANAAYMSLLGPEGFAEVGRLILGRSHDAASRLAAIDGVRVVFPEGFFKEFVVDFGGSGKTVAEVNRGLRERGIFGGIDLSGTFPALGEAALYCVTEIHTPADIDRLADAVAEVVA